MLGISILLAAASTTALATQAAGGTATGTDRAYIEEVVRDYILAHPEIIPEAMERLQAKKASEAVSGIRGELETPYAGAWQGAKDGDIVLVEFFDYACGYCRKSVADVEKLVKADPRLKVVYRELPILSEDSMKAARVSLLAARSGKYMAYHDALYAAGRIAPETILAAAQKAGLDGAAARAAMTDESHDAEINANIGMARKLQASGTPTFVVGDQVLHGAVGYDTLKEAVAQARSGGK